MNERRVDNPYSRLDYRRLIAWPKRIERESPMLVAEVERSPERSVVDLGCGTGEHARHLASLGMEVLGIDRSREQIAKALEYQDEFPSGPRFVCGEIEQLGDMTSGRYGAAICLGNVLPHLDDASLSRALEALSGCLLQGARLVVQLLNYERIARRGDRNLPLNVRDDPETDGEIVFLRLMAPDGDRHVRFFPSTLTLVPGEEPPLRVRSSREVRLRAWKRHDLEAILEGSGFRVDNLYGTMARGPFDPDESSDLILTAVKVS